MSVCDLLPLSQQEYWELEYQMEQTPDPDTIYTSTGRHDELAELLRKYGYAPCGRYEAFEFGVKLLELGVKDEVKTIDERSVDPAGRNDVFGQCSEPIRTVLEFGIPLRTTSTITPVWVSKRDEIRRMGLSEPTIKHDAEGLKMDIPEFLKVGNPIWCGFAGWIEDIAIGTDTIMVKVESPKRKLFNRNDEWLPYREGLMRPLTVEDWELDLDVMTRHLERIVREYELARIKMQSLISD